MFAGCLALAFAGPILAQDDYAASLVRLQALDARVQNIGWRLAHGNARFCAATRPAIGLLIQDLMGYNQPAQARAALAVPVDFAVQAAARGGPAQRAGLSANQPILAIDGHDLSKLARNAKAIFLRLRSVEMALQSSLDSNGAAKLLIAGKPQAVTIASEEICNTRFAVRPSNRDAVADGWGVHIGGKFPGLAYPDEELAAAMAHEMAHVVLRHPQFLADNGRKRRNVRRTEREADRLAPWLLVNAGYDPQAAVRFMKRWGPEHGGGLLRKRTHDGWDERVDLIEAEIAVLQPFIDPANKANWSANFMPQTP